METLRISLGNNETLLSGVFEERDGTFLAMTIYQSKYFKTLKGAQRWHDRKTGKTTKPKQQNSKIINQPSGVFL